MAKEWDLIVTIGRIRKKHQNQKEHRRFKGNWEAGKAGVGEISAGEWVMRAHSLVAQI